MLILERVIQVILLQERYVPVALMETSLLIERYIGVYHITKLREVQTKFLTTHCPGNVCDIDHVSPETPDNHGKKELRIAYTARCISNKCIVQSCINSGRLTSEFVPRLSSSMCTHDSPHLFSRCSIDQSALRS